MHSPTDASPPSLRTATHGLGPIGSLLLHRIGLAPTAHCRSPGALRKILDTTRTAARSAPSRGAAAATQVNSSYLNPFVSNAQADGSTAGFANCATTAALINSLDSRFSVCISPNGNGMSAYATSRHLYQSEWTGFSS